MRRREFIAVLGGAAAWPLVARAQQTSVPLVGVLRNTSKSDAEFRLVAFRDGLREMGFTESRNIAIEYRYADNQYDRLPAFAAELIRLPVSVLFASGNASALTAKRATSTIPVIFAVGSDPVQMGLVEKLNRPNGNVTGVSFFTILVGKRFELMREITSPSATIAYLQDVNNPNAELEDNEFEAAASSLGQRVTIIRIKGGADLETAFVLAKTQGAAGLIVAAGSFEFRWREQLVSLAARYALPAIFAGREIVAAGGLISYSGSQTEAHRLAGTYCARVLRGDKPAELPVLLPNRTRNGNQPQYGQGARHQHSAATTGPRR